MAGIVRGSVGEVSACINNFTFFFFFFFGAALLVFAHTAAFHSTHFLFKKKCSVALILGCLHYTIKIFLKKEINQKTF